MGIVHNHIESNDHQNQKINENANQIQQQNKGNKKIGTHNQNFHTDDVLACVLLTKYTDTYKDATIIRSRDEHTLEQMDILVDVGGTYDLSRHRFDHHQKEFNETFNDLSSVRLSSAGLIFKHFGEEIMRNAINKHILDLSQEQLERKYTIDVRQILMGDYTNSNSNKVILQLKQKMYDSLIKSVDAIDNGLNQYNARQAPNFRITTALDQRVTRLNYIWPERHVCMDSRFKEALAIVEDEFISQLNVIALRWFPGRVLVERAVADRLSVDDTGQIIFFEHHCMWKDHLFDIEREQTLDGLIKFVVFRGQNNDWRVQAVPNQCDGFMSRLGLKEEWRGVHDRNALRRLSGIDDIVFCHQTGFIGGAKSFKSVIQMALLSIKAAQQKQLQQ